MGNIIFHSNLKNLSECHDKKRGNIPKAKIFVFNLKGGDFLMGHASNLPNLTYATEVMSSSAAGALGGLLSKAPKLG